MGTMENKALMTLLQRENGRNSSSKR